MQWIYLIGDDKFSLDCFAKMHFTDSRKTIMNDEQLEVRYDNNDHAVFYKEEDRDDIRINFEPSDLERYLQKLPFDDPRWIMLKYSDVKVLRKILCEKGFPKDIMIDCDGTDLALEGLIDKSRIIENGTL